MELLVCIKQVPDDSVSVTLDGAGQPKLEGITPVVNAFDTYALEMAARFKEAHGGAVSVLTCGDPEGLTPSLRSCLSVGADKAFVVPCADDCGVVVRSRLLAQAAQQAAGTPFDVIFCGSESTDLSSSELGARLAKELGLPLVVNVLALEPRESGLTVKQETEDGYRTVEVPCPCVLTVVKPDYEPRYPSIKSKMAARKAPIGKLELEAPAAQDTVCHKAFVAPAVRQSGEKIVEKEAAVAVSRAMEILAGRKLV